MNEEILVQEEHNDKLKEQALNATEEQKQSKFSKEFKAPPEKINQEIIDNQRIDKFESILIEKKDANNKLDKEVRQLLSVYKLYRIYIVYAQPAEKLTSTVLTSNLALLLLGK